MCRFLVLSLLLVVAAAAHEAGKEHKHHPRPIKGVSKENMLKLREAMKGDTRKTAEERHRIVETFVATLSGEEKTAFVAHLEQMKKRREHFKKRDEANKGERKERREKGEGERDEKKEDKEDRKERRHEKRGERNQERKKRREEEEN